MLSVPLRLALPELPVTLSLEALLLLRRERVPTVVAEAPL